jgi:protein TonB
MNPIPRRRKAALLGAVVAVNLVMFVVLPYLLMPHTDNDSAARAEGLHAVRFVRLAEKAPRPETPRVEAPPQEKPLKTPETLQPLAIAAPPVPAPMDVALPALAFSLDLAKGRRIETAALPAAGPQTVFDQADVDQVPVAVVKSRPGYPYRARRMNLSGEVQVKFLVTPEGRVRDIRIISARPPDVFDHSVRSALSAWRFEPGRMAGRPVSTWVTTTIVFNLEEAG